MLRKRFFLVSGILLLFSLFSCEKGEKELLQLVKQYSMSDPNLALKYSDKLITKSIENNDTEMLFNAYLYRGVILTDKGDHIPFWR